MHAEQVVGREAWLIRDGEFALAGPITRTWVDIGIVKPGSETYHQLIRKHCWVARTKEAAEDVILHYGLRA